MKQFALYEAVGVAVSPFCGCGCGSGCGSYESVAETISLTVLVEPCFEKALACIGVASESMKKKSTCFTMVSLRDQRKKTLVSQLICLGINKKAQILHWFCLRFK